MHATIADCNPMKYSTAQSIRWIWVIKNNMSLLAWTIFVVSIIVQMFMVLIAMLMVFQYPMKLIQYCYLWSTIAGLLSLLDKFGVQGGLANSSGNGNRNSDNCNLDDTASGKAMAMEAIKSQIGALQSQLEAMEAIKDERANLDAMEEAALHGQDEKGDALLPRAITPDGPDIVYLTPGNPTSHQYHYVYQ